MGAQPTAGRGLGLAALILGALLVVAYDVALAPYRYPYVADSASYVEMAASLKAEGRPLVTPWDVEAGDRDAVPQPLFPPGFSLLIAALTPLAGDERSAAVWPSRVAAALLPLLIFVLFRGVVPDGALLGVALFALLDVLALAALWTLRLLAGAAAIHVVLSAWLLSFGAFLFLSLSLIKRCV